MPYKDESLSFTINGRRKSPVQTNIQYTTQDKGTAKLSFQLMKDGVPLPLSAAVVKLVLLMSDGSRFVRNIEITDKLNGRLSYVLSDEEIRHVGTVQAELDVSYTNQQAMSIHEFSFEIKKALIDTAILPSVEYYIDDFESLKNKINELYNETIQTVEELREKFEDLENIETKDGAQKKADAVQVNLDTHKNDKSNPHGVTKSQVGLGNVDNVKQADFYEFRAHNLNNERHVTKNDKDKWNAGQLYKLTQDNGRVFYKASSEATDYNELTDTGMYLIYNAGLHGPGLTQCFLLVMSYGNTLVQTAYDATNGLKSFNRIRKNDWETWTPWIEIETVEGTQKRVDAHANKTDIHVSKTEKDKWNGAQLSKITADHGGVSIAANEGEDILQKIVDQGRTMGTFYAHGKAVNAPSTYSTRGMFHLTGLSSDGKGMYGWVYATDYKNNVFTNYYDGSTTYWSGWKRLLTESDTDRVPWLNATYKNGAKTGDRQLQYKKEGGALHLTGHIVTNREVVFASIPSSFAPSKSATEMVGVSGTTGMSKLIVFSSGDLKLTGLIANDSNAVNGYYIDKVIPLN
ncbi:BppU family phage baseplate upper protein [Bacillus subtilis]|uniref:BppU family phage baseplate upper protein n=2 Tax=Bacillus subtilis TaxID=1423 RepID=UPI001E49F240|nr:BppU family phage baseplate upper protein [Bacillus subtilis]MDH3144586.1 BppU family phage baseplate upper protein [Bacillus subtilis]MDH3148783.1 BppU family phage baseplate upper protein [Bacillus subtilis]